MYKWILGGAAVIFAGKYLSELSLASENIIAQVSVQIQKVSLSGIELRAIVRLQNPNPIGLRLQHPFVQLKYKDSVIGNSVIKNELINLERNSEEMFALTIRSAGWLSLVQTLGVELAQKIRGGKGVHFQIHATTSTRVNNLPFSKEDIITITI